MNKSGLEYEVDLTKLVYGGDAMGRLPDDRAVFVPFALPGERVRLRLVGQKSNHARAELLEVLTPAAGRLTPRCIHFGRCGGCHYQHLSSEAQLAAKALILEEQLQRIGGIAAPPLRAMIPSPRPFGYRNHVEFHLTPQGGLGFHQAMSGKVIAIQECHLPVEPLQCLWPQMDFEAIPSLQRIGLRCGYEDDIQLILEGQDLQPPDFSVEELPLSAVYLGPAGPVVLAGSPALCFEILGRPFQVSAGSFFQVNTELAAVMVQLVLEALQPEKHHTVLDVYCGVGLFSAFLAERAGRLIGIETSPSAAEDFVANLDEFDQVELYEVPAERVLPHLDERPDLAVVDPPRAGMHWRALEGLLALQPQRIAYVSCDPATLARDARRLLAGGYALEQVTLLDMFPQTYHIESVSTWRRAEG